MLMLAKLANTVNVFADAARQHIKAIDLHIATSRQDMAGKKATAENNNYSIKSSEMYARKYNVPLYVRH